MGAAIIGIAILLSFPAYADKPGRGGYFDIEYAVTLWEEPTIEAFMGQVKHFDTPKVAEAYRVYKEIRKKSEKQAYLAEHPLKEKIKKLSDAVRVFHRWKSVYGAYAQCSDDQINGKSKFLTFDTFKKAHEVYAEVNCWQAVVSCAKLSRNPVSSWIEWCAVLPDWRTAEQKAADENRAKDSNAIKKLPQ